jgi:hypothetical protein
VLIPTGPELTHEEEAIIASDWGYVFYKSENLESLVAQLDQVAL